MGRWFKTWLRGTVGGWKHICWSFLNTHTLDCMHTCTQTHTSFTSELYRSCLCASPVQVCSSQPGHSSWDAFLLPLSIPSVILYPTLLLDGLELSLLYHVLACTDGPGSSVTGEGCTGGQRPTWQLYWGPVLFALTHTGKVKAEQRSVQVCMSTESGFQGFIFTTDNTCAPGLSCLLSIPTEFLLPPQMQRASD